MNSSSGFTSKASAASRNNDMKERTRSRSCDNHPHSFAGSESLAKAKNTANASFFANEDCKFAMTSLARIIKRNIGAYAAAIARRAAGFCQPAFQPCLAVTHATVRVAHAARAASVFDCDNPLPVLAVNAKTNASPGVTSVTSRTPSYEEAIALLFEPSCFLTSMFAFAGKDTSPSREVFRTPSTISSKEPTSSISSISSLTLTRGLR